MLNTFQSTEREEGAKVRGREREQMEFRKNEKGWEDRRKRQIKKKGVRGIDRQTERWCERVRDTERD